MYRKCGIESSGLGGRLQSGCTPAMSHLGPIVAFRMLLLFSSAIGPHAGPSLEHKPLPYLCNTLLSIS